MPIMGLGIHVLIALFFAIHAIRSGREMYWLMILFAFPLLGSIVYFFAVYLPDTRLPYDMRKAANTALRKLNPGKELQEAEEAFAYSPTAQNQIRLANALLEAGETEKAVQNFKACLQGPFANDPEIRFGAAKASLMHGDGADTIELIETIKKQNSEFRPDEIALLLAKAYTLDGRFKDAKHEFETAISRSGTVELQIEFAIWALSMGDRLLANNQYQEIQQKIKRWNKHTRGMNRDLLNRLETAFAQQSAS